MSKLEGKISDKFKEFKTRVIEKKQGKNKSKRDLQPEKIDYDHLTLEMPIMLKISLYHNFKKVCEVIPVSLHSKENDQFSFFTAAKQLVEGNQKLSGETIEYFKSNLSQEIIPMPLFFKHVSNNEICFDKIHINLGQV